VLGVLFVVLLIVGGKLHYDIVGVLGVMIHAVAHKSAIFWQKLSDALSTEPRLIVD